MKLDCPHCQLPALSGWRKLALGFARSVPCQSCGLRVTVSSPAALAAMLPSLGVVLAVSLRWLRDPLVMGLAGVAAIASTTLLHVWAVPLVKAQVTDPRAVERARAAGSARR